jgi:Bacterial protein of unknown function (DUF899)
MGVTFPNETPEYRAARNKLLQRGVALRREMEAVAAEIRALSAGGAVPEDYEFDHIDEKGAPAKVRLSELFRPGSEVDLLGVELDPPGLDLGQIEDLIDQLQEVIAGAPNTLQGLDEVVPAEFFGVLFEHLGEADDRIEGRSQLVAHVGQELALGLGRLRRGVARRCEFRLSSLELGHVRESRHGTAVLRLTLAELDPAVSIPMQMNLPRIAVACEPFRHPLLDAAYPAPCFGGA